MAAMVITSVTKYTTEWQLTCKNPWDQSRYAISRGCPLTQFAMQQLNQEQYQAKKPGRREEGNQKEVVQP